MGLFGSLHCISMCGSIAGVLSISLPQKTRCNPSMLVGYLGVYNLGRLFSYSLAGAAAGAFGSQLLHMLSPEQGHLYLLLAASAMMIAVPRLPAGVRGALGRRAARGGQAVTDPRRAGRDGREP